MQESAKSSLVGLLVLDTTYDIAILWVLRGLRFDVWASRLWCIVHTLLFINFQRFKFCVSQELSKNSSRSNSKKVKFVQKCSEKLRQSFGVEEKPKIA